MGKGVVWAIAGVAVLFVAGCCRSSGPTHKCDFTPIEPSGDGGSDGPMLCGTAVCEDGDVCCYTKAPAHAACIPPARFGALRCEQLELPCTRPSDCPGGDAVSCCLKLNEDGTGNVTCQPTTACVLQGGFRACDTDSQCPSAFPACQQVSEDPPFSICR